MAIVKLDQAINLNILRNNPKVPEVNTKDPEGILREFLRVMEPVAPMFLHLRNVAINQQAQNKFMDLELTGGTKVPMKAFIDICDFMAKIDYHVNFKPPVIGS